MYRMTIRFLLPLLALAAISCADAQTMRSVDLALTPELPSGLSELDGDQLHVTVTGLEALVDRAGYAVWWQSDDGETTALGALDADLSLEITLPTGLLSGTVVLTEESDVTTTLPETPSTAVRLEGPAGGALSFASDYQEALAGSSGEVTLINATAEGHLEGLPEPPQGMHYALWAACGGQPAGAAHDDADDDGNAHKSGGHDEDESGGEHMGRLAHVTRIDSSGSLNVRHSETLATCRRLIVTLESEHGVDEMAPILILSGDVVTPESHDGGGGGGHMH